MKAFLPAAGLGSRLRPITELMPKPLVPVMNEPLLAIAIRQLTKAGFGPFAVNAHYLPEQIEDFAATMRSEGYQIQVSVELPKILGTGGAFMPLKPWICDEAFLVYNGDLLSNIDFAALKNLHTAQDNLVTMALRPGHNGKDLAVWGTIEEGFVLIHDIAKKAPEVPGIKPYTFGCAYVTSPKLLSFLPASGESFVIDGMVAGLRSGLKIRGLVHAGFWSDLGTPESLFATNMAVMAEGKVSQAAILGLYGKPIVRIHPSAVTDSSAYIAEDVIVGARVKIGSGARISRSVLLADTVVGSNEVIENSICGPRNMRISIPGQKA